MIPFPFIGSSIPEGHQGQSVEGMSHGSVIAKLKHGFHTNRCVETFRFRQIFPDVGNAHKLDTFVGYRGASTLTTSPWAANTIAVREPVARCDELVEKKTVAHTCASYVVCRGVCALQEKMRLFVAPYWRPTLRNQFCLRALGHN